ncbi:hypothetical protein SESBI_50084, partial [Sesbania bispinosa]
GSQGPIKAMAGHSTLPTTKAPSASHKEVPVNSAPPALTPTLEDALKKAMEWE